MDYIINILSKKLIEEQSDRILFTKALESHDELTKRMAQGNINPCEHRISELQTMIKFLTEAKYSTSGTELNLKTSNKETKILVVK